MHFGGFYLFNFCLLLPLSTSGLCPVEYEGKTKFLFGILLETTLNPDANTYNNYSDAVATQGIITKYLWQGYTIGCLYTKTKFAYVDDFLVVFNVKKGYTFDMAHYLIMDGLGIVLRNDFYCQGYGSYKGFASITHSIIADFNMNDPAIGMHDCTSEVPCTLAQVSSDASNPSDTVVAQGSNVREESIFNYLVYNSR